jgi:hypothetical protein
MYLAAMPALLPLIAAAAALTTVNVPTTLGDHLDRAKDRSGIDVLLPETIRTEFKKVYPSSLPSTSGRYALVIGAVKNCNGASVCGIANFYGIGGEPLKGGKKVALAKGHKGRYYKSKCGANCSFPSVAWKQSGVRYTIEFKESKGKANMVSLANSAITAGPR